MKITAQPITTALPLCRRELLVELLQGRHGNVDQCWMFPGHVFVAHDNAKSLTVIDCMPASLQQLPQSSPLDLRNLDSPILDVLQLCRHPHRFAVVLKSGLVQTWEFQDCQWGRVGQHSLSSSSPQVLVQNVCFQPQHHALYWTQSPTPLSPLSLTVCRQSWPQDAVGRGNPGPDIVAVQSCGPCQLLAVGTILLAVSKVRAGEVPVCLALGPDMQGGAVFLGDIELSVDFGPDHPVDLQAFLTANIPTLALGKSAGFSLGAMQDPALGTGVTLTSTGHVQIFSQTEPHQPLRLRTVQLQGFGEAGMAGAQEGRPSSDLWSVNQGLLGFLIPTALRLYNLNDGTCAGELPWPGEVTPSCLVPAYSTAVLACFLSADQLYQVQGGVRGPAPGREGQPLPDHAHFQTEALHLASLVQRRNETFSPEKMNALNTLHEAWRKGDFKSRKTELSCIVEPYISEFWRLENLQKSLNTENLQIGQGKPLSVHSEIQSLVSGESALPLESQQSRLLWLCQSQPPACLAALASCLDLDLSSPETVQAIPVGKWERLLGREGLELSPESALKIYEHICGLLFRLKPELLIMFVSAAQTAVQRSVGVSAFLRKKHMCQCYLRALECLPEPGASVSPVMAATATAQLILASSESRGEVRAVNFLLQHGAWRSALELTGEQCQRGSAHSPCLLFLTLSSLAQHGVLADFSKEMFSLLPSWERFLTLCGAMESQGALQHSASGLGDVFAQGQALSIEAVRPFLLQLASGRSGH